MKIISPFKDFYDSALQFGQDDFIKYIRKTEEEVYRSEKDMLCDPLIRGFDENYDLQNRTRTNYGESCFIINGKLHLFVTTTVHDLSFTKISVRKDRLTQEWVETNLSPKYHNCLKRVLDIDELTFVEMHREFNSPILKVRGERSNYLYGWNFDARSHKEFFIDVNPCLRQYNLHKFFNPFELYQEIEMFIGAYFGTTARNGFN